MIVKRKLFSKLPDSRIGIGWMQEKLGKNESEKYFKIGKQAADDSFEKGEDEDTVVNKSKKAAGNRVLLDKSGKPILKGTIAAALGYGLSKSPEIVESLAKNYNIDVNIPSSVKRALGRHSGKIALGSGLVVAGKYVPEIYNKRKAAMTGMEINTRDRIKKSNKKKNR